MSSEVFKRIQAKFSNLQETMCAIMEEADGNGKFSRDGWDKAIGGGLTRVLHNGNHIEKAAINFSAVSGKFTLQMEQLLGVKASTYSATGISSIIHPRNPHAPIIHMNVRYFELDNGECWFGGGIDLTPHYISKNEAKWFHQELKNICDTFDNTYYPKFKSWADDYFYLPHRNETRGVGGIFFDRIQPSEAMQVEQLIAFTSALAEAYPKLYSKLLLDNANKSFTEQEKEWQKVRRGRYAEFNLIYDRGTKFGLQSGGNTESILVSLPPEAVWEYKYAILPMSDEEKTQALLVKDIDWVNMEINCTKHVC